jgi:hypothetical protein
VAFAVGSYLDEFLFDAVLADDQGTKYGMSITSFAATALPIARVEQEVGHFIFAASRVDETCIAVVQPSAGTPTKDARLLNDRVSRWMRAANIPVLSVNDVKTRFGPTLLTQGTQLTLLSGMN